MSRGTASQQDFEPARAAALLIAAQRGRDGALGDLVDVCTPLVRHYAGRAAWRAHDVDDVVQEVWVRLVLKVDQIHSPMALRAWLRVVTERVASEMGRTTSRLVPTCELDDQPSHEAVEDDVVERHHRVDGLRRLGHATGRMRQQDRELLLLLHRDDRPRYAEISDAVRRPVGSLGPTRQRLLSRLRRDEALAPLCRPVPAG